MNKEHQILQILLKLAKTQVNTNAAVHRLLLESDVSQDDRERLISKMQESIDETLAILSEAIK